jgi:hypothetical protein
MWKLLTCTYETRSQGGRYSWNCMQVGKDREKHNPVSVFSFIENLDKPDCLTLPFRSQYYHNSLESFNHVYHLVLSRLAPKLELFALTNVICGNTIPAEKSKVRRFGPHGGARDFFFLWFF